MFNISVDLREKHFIHRGLDCYYKVWVASIEYAKTPDSETTIEEQQFNTKREAITWALMRATEILPNV